MRVIFAIHQIGSQADGGLRSITEMIRNVPEIDKYVVTNLDTDLSKLWRSFGGVAIWPMTESSYTAKRSRILYRAQQIHHRLRNNFCMFLLVRRRGIQVVHANDHRAFWNTALGAKLAGARVIFNVRDTLRSGSKTRPFWRACLALCDRFLVLSAEMVAHFREALQPTSQNPRHREKFAFIYSIVDRKIYYPVESAERDALRSRLSVAGMRPALVYVGRFDDKKAQLDFIRRALPGIVSARPDALVYFVGDFEPQKNSYAAACATAVRELDLSRNVRFVGYSAAVADWYRAADIVVLASRREGLPRCIIEGLSCGAAVVSFAVSSAREILVEHDCGVVVPLEDYPGLCAEILALMGDEARATAYRARGAQVALKLFAAEKNAARYRQLLHNLVNAPSGVK